MKRQQLVAALLAGVGLLGAGFWVGKAFAGTNDPGSAADPLVSKSYVDQAIANLAPRSYVDQAIAGVTGQVTDLAGKAGFGVVMLPKGSSLIGESGTEFALRGGQAVAIVSPKGGLLDATEGTDLNKGQAIKANHLLIIPVSDGRGVLATKDAILIVKGAYSVKPANP